MLPVEVLIRVGRALLALDMGGTAASLMRTCKSLYRALHPQLCRTVVLTARGIDLFFGARLAPLCVRQVDMAATDWHVAGPHKRDDYFAPSPSASSARVAAGLRMTKTLVLADLPDSTPALGDAIGSLRDVRRLLRVDQVLLPNLRAMVMEPAATRLFAMYPIARGDHGTGYPELLVGVATCCSPRVLVLRDPAYAAPLPAGRTCGHVFASLGALFQYAARRRLKAIHCDMDDGHALPRDYMGGLVLLVTIRKPSRDAYRRVADAVDSERRMAWARDVGRAGHPPKLIRVRIMDPSRSTSPAHVGPRHAVDSVGDSPCATRFAQAAVPTSAPIGAAELAQMCRALSPSLEVVVCGGTDGQAGDTVRGPSP